MESLLAAAREFFNQRGDPHDKAIPNSHFENMTLTFPQNATKATRLPILILRSSDSCIEFMYISFGGFEMFVDWTPYSLANKNSKLF